MPHEETVQTKCEPTACRKGYLETGSALKPRGSLAVQLLEAVLHVLDAQPPVHEHAVANLMQKFAELVFNSARTPPHPELVERCEIPPVHEHAVANLPWEQSQLNTHHHLAGGGLAMLA